MGPRDYLVSVVRTGVPILWGTLLSWLVSRQIIDSDTATAVGDAGATVAVLAAAVTSWLYYALVRLLEPRLLRLPLVGPWLVRLLLGSTQAPAYDAAGRHTAP